MKLVMGPRKSDSDYLNSFIPISGVPNKSDVVVIGGGIHSLIYAIHARMRCDTLNQSASITVLEKLTSPEYKIGESTLTTLGIWLKSIGIGTSLLWRLFGVKDGLAFYFLPANGKPNEYTDFSANGPAGNFVATLQIERQVSELLLTLYAQRLGVTVLHGHIVDIDAVRLPEEGTTLNGLVNVASSEVQRQIETKLVVDATGRFRRLASKAARKVTLPGFNTDAFWAYWEMKGDEDSIALDHYESLNTNHICIPEGWAWVIRLPSWQGTPIPNLVAMVNYLLDLNAANTPADSYPSARELAAKFGCKYRWVVSIGYALRSDVMYPANLDCFGTCEAERKFRWVTSRYPDMQALMDRHILIPDLYGPKTTWFVRKGLTFSSPVVAGAGWAAIGDATGFTNPLFSPGINCNMATSVFLAEKTPAYLSAVDSPSRRAVLDSHNAFCARRVANLHRMNLFNYSTFRSPRLGRLGPLWQYLCGTGNRNWQRIGEFTSFERVAELVTAWEWGSNAPEYIEFADAAIKLLAGPPETAPGKELEDEVLAISERMMGETLRSGKYKNRWAGLLRYYDDDLKFNEKKIGRDQLASRCKGCRNWRMLTGEARKCPVCGADNDVIAIQRFD
jgi:flavin-dependent dehydrogenase